MTERFMIDTSIWIDVYEDRKGFNGEPLGEYGLKLLSYIKNNEGKIIITNILIEELGTKYNIPQINGMLKPFKKIIEAIRSTKEQDMEARKVALQRNVPKGDALHAILARDNKAIVITRDKHFRILEDISEHYRPEELT